MKKQKTKSDLIKRQEAIKELQFMRNAIERGDWIHSNDNRALDMAIEALEGKDIDVPSRKGVFIPDITVEMFRNASLEGVEELMASGVMEDVSLPSTQPEVIRCKDCKWWDKSENSLFGYCMAMKHGFMSANWEIGIYRRYKGDFYCADAERENNET